MSGITIDPDKCFTSAALLAIKAASYSFPVSLAAKVSLQQDINFFYAFANVAPLSISFTEIIIHSSSPNGRYKFNPFAAVRDVWRDCNGGGWLTKHLDSAKAKMNAGLDKVGEKLFPNAAPESETIPVSAYAVSDEAIANRATSFSSISKGVVTGIGVGLMAAASAALFILGARSVPMSGATAGFGVTTDYSPFSSNRNQIL